MKQKVPVDKAKDSPEESNAARIWKDYMWRTGLFTWKPGAGLVTEKLIAIGTVSARPLSTAALRPPRAYQGEGAEH